VGELQEWREDVVGLLRAQLRDDKHWSRKLANGVRVHVAVMVEPWLSWILSGEKTIESRWSARRTVPFEQVAVGDVLLLKASSGPVKGICEVADTWFFDLEQTGLTVIRDRFGEAIAGGDAFWKSVEGSRYVTLIKVRAARAIAPIACPKRDRRGWVVL
jgi:hypothetical protein